MSEADKRHIIQWECDTDDGLTRREIAQAAGLRKHPALIALIETMVSEGVLAKASTPYPNGKEKFHYKTVEHYRNRWDVS